jgi:hypothetical protein
MTSITPAVWPNDLEPDVLAWYQQIHREGGTIQSVLRDRGSRPENTFNPFTDDELKCTKALVAAGLATYNRSRFPDGGGGDYVWINTLWKYASVARDGSDYDWYATVHVLDEKLGARDRNGVIIAFLHGAELDRRDGDTPFPEWRLRVKHVTATDFEHDAVHLANFQLLQVVIDQFSHFGGLTVMGILGEAEMYGRGNDPIENKTPDDENDSNWCDGWPNENGSHTPHPFAPYTVKDDEHKARLAKFKGRLVRIEMTPRGLVDANGQLLRKREDEDEDDA